MSAGTHTRVGTGYSPTAPAETYKLWHPRVPPTGQRVVVVCHGAGGTYAVGPHESTFVLGGLSMIATDLGGAQTWGSDASLSRIDEAWDYAVSQLGVSNDKIILWGGSMGSLTALLYARENPANVACVGVALPIVDPEQVRSEDAGGYQSEIEAIHGVGTVPSPKRPNQNAGDYTMPVALWASVTDTVGDYTLAEDFAGDIGADFHSLGSVGHSYLSMDNNEALTFLGEHLRP